MANSNASFELLHRMDRAARASAPALPEQVEAAAVWSGLGFRVGEMNLLADLAQVREVVPYTAVTPVPGTRRWLRGVSNVRGELLTIVDFSDFLGRAPILPGAKTRMLLLNVPGLRSAVMVDEVLGLRHFYQEDERREIGFVDKHMSEYLVSSFAQDDVNWLRFDMERLAGADSFLHVAA